MAESIDDGTEQEELITIIEETSSISRFRTQPQAVVEAKAMCVMIHQEERDQLTATDLNKLRSKATQEMTTNFSVLPMMDTNDQLANTYNVAMRIKEFNQKLKAYDMKDVFNLVIPIPRHDGKIEPNRVMLTEAYNYKDVTEEMVRTPYDSYVASDRSTISRSSNGHKNYLRTLVSQSFVRRCWKRCSESQTLKWVVQHFST